tara:strand:- start:9 stop:410 length:402 start_codon:yes stop_codon:yes gene_type:complete
MLYNTTYMLYLFFIGFVAISHVFSYTTLPISMRLGDKITPEEDEPKSDPLFDEGLNFQGIDMRNPSISDLDISILYEVGVNMKKKVLLKTLEDDEVGLPRKLKMLEYNDLLDDTLKVNILTAGLLDDWEFDIT